MTNSNFVEMVIGNVRAECAGQSGLFSLTDAGPNREAHRHGCNTERSHGSAGNGPPFEASPGQKAPRAQVVRCPGEPR
jgi:hypothetical protein